MTKEYPIKKVAKILGKTVRRTQAKMKQGHFPHKKPCPCGHGWLIPQRDVDANLRGDIPDRRRKAKSKA